LTAHLLDSRGAHIVRLHFLLFKTSNIEDVIVVLRFNIVS
jgi:hypothetical protein